jgi:adenosylmethionine-8-amino-7-oxononanoate aminotransferase
MSAGQVARDLAGYFIEHDGTTSTTACSTRRAVPPESKQAKGDMLYSIERVFWEVNDYGVNFDYVDPKRRGRVIQVFDRLNAHESYEQDPASTLRGTLPTAVAGHGVFITDSSGKSTSTLPARRGVVLGHGHPTCARCTSRSTGRLRAHQQLRPPSPRTRRLRRAPRGISHVYMVSGGSEAIEASPKSRARLVEIGQPQRKHFIARRQSYHGNTRGALAVGGNEWRRVSSRRRIDVQHVSPCYEYRDRLPGETPGAVRCAVVREIEGVVDQLGGGNVIAFCAETVVGATVGANPPAAGHFKGIRELCDRHGIPLLADEVMCGMATGTPTRSSYEGSRLT